MLCADGKYRFFGDKLPFQNLSRWKLFVTRLWCWTDGHGGVTHPPGPRAASYSHGICKRCGLSVKL